MKSIFESAAQEELHRRVEKLGSQTAGQWGKMDAAQMLAHCTAIMQVPVGDLRVKRSLLSLIGWMFKGMILSDKPFSKNSPTSDEFLIRDKREFDTEKRRFIESFNKLARGPEAVTCHDHPFFGTITSQEWGHLMYKHLDHHFKQFGV
jgi:hypothetical protein